jgi:DNA invertase Pin-like site-specific DNA recombinase
MRAALYARYGSDNQRENSITDQLRLCRVHAERQGWNIIEEYSDHAISGASLLRPGVQALMSDANRGRFDIILTESLDRLSRDQEDVAGLYKRMKFAGVRIVTVSEGEISELHIGLKGTMGALYLKDLADKTRRGLYGRIEAGKSGGGLCFGYDVVRRLSDDGQPIRGDRVINRAEADVVRRIFREYADGKSSRAIAWALNKDGIRGPFGHAWGPSTIHGNPKRGNGILNNELYIGRLVWNRQRFIKDPETGKRVSRLNPEAEWIIQEVPELRIVDHDLWDRVKQRQRALAYTPKDATSPNPMLERRRPKHLLAGLAKCGRLRWRLHADLRAFARLRDGAKQGHVHQPAQHPARRARGLRAERPQDASDASGPVQGVLRGVHSRDQPAAARGASLASGVGGRAAPDRSRTRQVAASAEVRRADRDDRRGDEAARGAQGRANQPPGERARAAAAAASEHGRGLAAADRGSA